MKCFTLTLIALMMRQFVMGDETNFVYVTDDGRANQIVFYASNNIYVKPAQIEAARTLKECLPAKDFPEGNWGEINMGIQVSLRFYKENYSNDEPIRAIVLIRNTGTNFFMFLGSNPITFDSPVCFQAITKTGDILRSKKTRPDMLAISGGAAIAVYPGTQRKFILPLNDLFDFTNGTYEMQASVFTLDNSAASSDNTIKSAKVKIGIK